MRGLIYLLLVSLCAAPLGAQVVADYKESGNLFGTRNMTARYAPPIPPAVSAPAADAADETWSDVVENDEWILTTWVEVLVTGATTATLNYRWRAYEKSSGYYTNYVSTANSVGNVTDSGNSFATWNINFGATPTQPLIRSLRPSIAFTKSDGSPDSYDGAVIAFTQPDPLAAAPAPLDVFLTFLRIDPNSVPPAGTQPNWEVDFARNQVNVSGSSGMADHPSVEGMDTGDIVVHWRDFTTDTTSTIGGVPSIFPQAPGNNPSGLPPLDIYARRYQQQFFNGGFGFGAVDNALPQGSTVNVTSSLGVEIDLDTATNGSNQTFVLTTLRSAQSDEMMGLGMNTGPLTGAFGAESSDTYVRVVSTNGASDLTLGAGKNISRSNGASTGSTSYIDFNRSLGQVGIMFADNTAPNSGGIGENSGLSSVQQGTAPNLTPEYDIYVRVLRSDLSHVNTTSVTQSALAELCADIASFSQNGYVVGYLLVGNSTTVADLRAFHSRVDATGKLSGTSAQYPVQSTVPAGGVGVTRISGISTFGTSNVSIIFSHRIDAAGGAPQEGTPENLRMTGGPLMIDAERPSATGSGDLFLTVGEPIAGNPAQGQLRVSSLTINGGEPVDPANPPAIVPVKLVIENVSPTSGLMLDILTISPPNGFSQIGQGPPLPVTVFPASKLTFNYEFAVAAGNLNAGSNLWGASASGFIAGLPTLGTGEATLSVLGVEGSLVGVDVIAQFNPTVLTEGQNQDIRVTIAVSNGGQETLRDISFEGALTTGFLPSDLRFKFFLPDPKTIEIPAGSIQVFETSISTSTLLEQNIEGANMKPNGYRPAVTMIGEQSNGMVGGAIRSGSVTVQTQVGIRVNRQIAGPKGVSQALINSGGGGGCAIRNANANWSLLGFGLLALSALLYRRREEA